jgi:4-amino-4-deoxy-L-arabinose transferase-like glycosyltransferase
MEMSIEPSAPSSSPREGRSSFSQRLWTSQDAAGLSQARLGFLLLAITFLVRFQYLLGSAVFGTDCAHYLLMADWMREGRWHDAMSIAYHPLYPLLIAAARSLLPSTEVAGGIVAVTLGASAVVPLTLLVTRLFGRSTAVLTALFYAFHPAILEVQSDAMTEGPYMFFFFSSMWLTWTLLEEPSLWRGAVTGAAAAAAFLTRPEGLLPIGLAVGWQALQALRLRTLPLRRIGAIAATLLATLLVLSPYVFWVRSVRGHWALSARPSAISAEKSIGVGDPREEGDAGRQDRVLAGYSKALVRVSLGGLWIPFLLLGLTTLKGMKRFSLLFYLSFPLGQWGGILWTLKTHGFMSERYLLAGAACLAAIGARGVLLVLRGAASQWPSLRQRPACCAAILLVLFVAPSLKCFGVRRAELASYRGAAAWLMAQDPRPLSVQGLEPVSYFCGCRSYYLPSSREALEKFLRINSVDYIAYSQKDLMTRPDFVAMLRSSERLAPAIEYQGPPRTYKVYFQKVLPPGGRSK